MGTLPFSSASERNRQPILDRLQTLLPEHGTVLEIGSGTGQHAVFFTEKMTGLMWQPSDREENLAGLEARFTVEGNKHIFPPLKLDVLRDPWPGYTFDAAFSANTAHIMSWDAVIEMFAGLSAHLQTGGRFFLYGPFNVGNCFTSQSNADFDTHLRAENPEMGIRDLEMIESLAQLHHMSLEYRLVMPANNFLLVFKKS